MDEAVDFGGHPVGANHARGRGVRDDFATFANTFFDDLHRFYTKTNTWMELLPGAGSARGAHLRGGRRRTAGLTSCPSSVARSSTRRSPSSRCSGISGPLPDDNEWTEIIADNEGLVPRSGATMWVDDDRALVFGGITQFFEFKNELWAYDSSSNTWTELIPDGAPGSPPGRHVASAGTATPHDELTIYGGENIYFSTFGFQILPDGWQLDLDTLERTDVTPAPARNVLSARNFGASDIFG